MSEETLWAVSTNTDLTEGRGRQYVKHFCRYRATAIRLAKQGYVQGSDCPISPVTVLVLEGQRVLPASLLKIEEPTREDEASQKIYDAREAALAKAKAAGLTEDEINLLRAQP